eukprot:1321251-Ditylum_brightwellii.AAC.1
MKIDPRSLEFVNHSIRNRPLPILFYVLEKKEKLIPSNYQVYKLCTNHKDKKLTMYLLVVKYYKVGAPEEWLQFIDAISQLIKGQDIQYLEAVYTLWKLEFKKEDFDLSSVALKGLLGVCVCLEQAEMHKPLAKKISCANKDHDEATEGRKARHHDEFGLCHKRSQGHRKHHTRKCKKKFFNYYYLCHHDTEECDYYQTCRKHI